MLGKNLIQAAAGNAGGEVLGVEDVFSTWLYTGNGSTQTITNGIDLAGEGGLVWTKGRSAAENHGVSDTVRGSNATVTNFNGALITNGTSTGSTANHVTAFNSDGFTLGSSVFGNGSSTTYASWTFRKAAKFFDVVTYTGTGSARTIAHNLGSVPGCIIVKRTDTTANWAVYHQSVGTADYLTLNNTLGAQPDINFWNSTAPTSTEFTVGSENNVNILNGTFVAYLFAHDAGGFGDSGNDSVVKCGTYSATGSSGVVVDLGWEPQWLLIKKSSGPGNWFLIDNMRGMSASTTALLEAQNSGAENTIGSGYFSLSATGFTITTTDSSFVGSGDYIYIAIRRGPMKTPTDATTVFSANTYAGGTAGRSFNLGFVPDALLTMRRNTSNFDILQSRLTGLGYMFTNDTGAETSATTGIPAWDANTETIKLTTATSVTGWNGSGSDYVNEVFRRAPGFFDVVAYTGTGVARTVSHNLGVAPELMIVKHRTDLSGSVGNRDWAVYSTSLGPLDYLALNKSDATQQNTNYWNNTSPTSTNFSLGIFVAVNRSSTDYISYLFATCPGVSKVGSYTGTGTTLDIDCGFTSGARFVLIKRTDSTGDWYVWDTARGIVAGNDPYLLLNSTAAEVTSTDYIDPLSSGFQISSTAPAAINANGGSYIYLAIA